MKFKILFLTCICVSVLGPALEAEGARRPGRGAWERYINPPAAYSFEKSVEEVSTFSFEDFDAVLLRQSNGPGTSQRVLKVYPKGVSGEVPAVVVPFYFPEAMIGQELDTREELERYSHIRIMADLAKRGIASISADSYHLTYIDSDLPRDKFSRWQLAGSALMKDWPEWTGMGKLVSDTRLLIDLLEEDPRIDASRIGIAGHSLGGKMAFYTGCLDKRVKVMMLSDFGFLWEQSNWEKVWYWGDKLEELKASGMDHTGLLALAGGKPVILLAGKYDNDDSLAAMKASGRYRRNSGKLVVINHATGHRPPDWALEKGYDFLEKYLKK